MYRVKNIDQTTQVLFSKGKRIELKSGESIWMESPPKESYIFHIEQIAEEQEEPKKLKTKLKGGQ